ncbi:hypothetical protein [Halalkalicoccus salilacus]|uniref:hypothetical protein n=1 Tax=Halalkalicoccus sp. GCM10025704 TaxID=3252662 RepID=UPI00361092A9
MIADRAQREPTGNSAPILSPSLCAQRQAIITTSSATMLTHVCVTAGSSSPISPPEMPASAVPRTTTPNPGTVTPVTYRKEKPSVHDTSAGSTPVSTPR